MRSLLLRCYPTRWRARYGDEFLALLEERPLGPFDVADILLGALDARLRQRRQGPHGHETGGLSMTLRFGGIAAIVGAGSLALALLVGANPAIADPLLPILIVIGSGALLVALTALSAIQARTAPSLVWTAFGLAAFGTVAILIGSFFAIGLVPDGAGSPRIPEPIVVLAPIVGPLAAIAGFALFGVVTYRVGVLSRPGAVLLAIGPPLMVAAWVIAIGVDWDLGGLAMLAAIGVFLGGWLALGVAAIRLDRPATESSPA